MTDMNEKLKLVAEYDGYDVAYINGQTPAFSINKETSVFKEVQNRLFYHSSYNQQIPVWQKVCKESIDIEKSTDDLKQFMLLKEKYCKHICYGTPLESFEILVQAIQFINKMKK